MVDLLTASQNVN